VVSVAGLEAALDATLDLSLHSACPTGLFNVVRHFRRCSCARSAPTPAAQSQEQPAMLGTAAKAVEATNCCVPFSPLPQTQNLGYLGNSVAEIAAAGSQLAH
jgi:hypothetical protein